MVRKDHWFLVMILSLNTCSGCYGPSVGVEKLKDFHRRRLQVLVEAGPDLLAFETIPNKLEAQVYMLFHRICACLIGYVKCMIGFPSNLF